MTLIESNSSLGNEMETIQDQGFHFMHCTLPTHSVTKNINRLDRQERVLFRDGKSKGN